MSTSLFAYLAGSDVGNKIRLNAIGLTNNADGATGAGGVVFDDEAGTLDVRGFMKVVIKELACTSAPILFSGYIGPRRYSRNQYRVGASRFVDCDLLDENYVLNHRLITGSDGKRPAETHNARITWLLASAYMSGLISDTSLVDTSNPRDFGEADYRGQYPSDVLQDISAPIFRTFFVYPTQTTGTRGLFFDTPTAVIRDSTLTISNVYSDRSSTCIAPSIDAVLTRDPSEVYSRVRYTYSKGTVVEDLASTVTTFFTDNGLGARGLQVDNSRIGSDASARIMADSILSRDAAEGDTITVTVILPAAQVGLIDAGMRIAVRFSHLPGYTTSTNIRVTSRTVLQRQDNGEYYDVNLTLNSHGRSGGGGGGAPGPGDFPLPPSATASIVQQVSGAGNVMMPAAITSGNTLVRTGGVRGAAPGTWRVDGGYTLGPNGVANDPGGTNAALIAYKVAGASESQYIGGIVGATNIGSNEVGTWYELTGTWTPSTNAQLSSVGLSVSTPSIAVAANSITFGVSAQGQGGAYDSVAATLTYTTAAPFTEDVDTYTAGGHPNVLTAHSIATVAGTAALGAVNSGNGGLSGTDYNFIAQIASFTQSGSTGSSPPAPGQWVPWTVVTMAGAVGTTAFPYAAGSLAVKVDGVLISRASYTETSPGAGTFTLSWSPDTDEVVTVTYQGI